MMTPQSPNNRPPQGARGAGVPRAPQQGAPRTANGRPAPTGAADGRTRVSRPATQNQQGRAGSGAPRAGGGSRPPGGGKKKRSTGKQVAVNILKALFVMFCFGVMVLSILSVIVVNYVVKATANDDAVLNLNTIKMRLSQSSMMVAEDSPGSGNWLDYQALISPDSYRIWVDLDQVPDNLVNAFVATEDRNFWNHDGVDIARTVKAGFNLFLGGDTYGASTIDQQLVKNLTGDDVVSDDESGMLAGVERKAREIFRAWGLNNNYSKEQIMEAYLNTLSLSGTRQGVQVGALEYFGKDVSELTLAECATIAGITQFPSRYDPFSNPENCRARRDDVLTFMLRDNYITRAQYDEAVNSELVLNPPDKQVSQQTESSGIFSWYADVAFEQVVDDLMATGNYESEAAARNYIYTAGLTIELPIDLHLQGIMEDLFMHGQDEGGMNEDFQDFQFYAYEHEVPLLDENGEEMLDANGEVRTYTESTQAGMAVVDPRTGALVGIVGGVGPKSESLTFNRGSSARQPGSSIKPITSYTLGVDYGLVSYSSAIVDAPVLVVGGGTVDATTGAVRPNWPSNYSRSYRNTPMPVVSALCESTNTVAVFVGEQVGYDIMFDFLQDTLQISTMDDTMDRASAPLALGSLSVGISPYQMAGAYQMFANGGEFHSLYCYTRVLDVNGQVVLEPKRTTVQAIKPETAYVMNQMLQRNVESVTQPSGAWPTMAGRGLEYGLGPSGGKSGTSGGNYDIDRWAVEITPYYSAAVWWGYDSHSEMLYGYGGRTNSEKEAIRLVLNEAHRSLEVHDFPEMPEGVEQHSYCALTGKLASSACTDTRTGWYITEYLESGMPGDCSQQEHESYGTMYPPKDEAAAA